MSLFTRSLIAPFGLALLATAPGLSAAPLEEITVSATFRGTNLKETVGSITVLTEEAIQARAAQHLQDILNSAPNVTWSAGSSRSRFVQIRGIGDLEQFYDPKYYPSVGIMLDNLELGDSASAGMLFDVAQVEVLRGPQGTRYGASAHAGMINIRSNSPTDEFEGAFSGGLGNYDSVDVGLVLSGPLYGNTRARLALQHNRSDGYIDNEQRHRDNTNNFDEATARARLIWEPTTTAQYELGLLYFDADNGYDAWSLDNNRTTNTDQPGDDTQETLALATSGNWQLANKLSVQASISYMDTALGQSYDVDWVSAPFCERFVCSSGHDMAREIFARERDRLVADIRLLGGSTTLAEGEGRYVLGLYANDGSEAFDYQYPSLWYGDSASNSDYDTRRYALYGEYEHALSNKLTVTLGGRVERFKDDYQDSNGFDTDNKDTLYNGELSARYSLNDDTMFYLTLARGSKPGGVNTTASANQPFMSPAFQAFTQDKLRFDEEILFNKEIGLKTLALDGRVSLDLALFHTDRENAQLESWMWDDGAGLWISYLDSTSDATSYGIELQATMVLNDYLQLFANTGWLRTEVDAIESFDLDEWAFVTRENRDQAKAPRYQYNVGAQVQFSGSLQGRIELEGQDDSFYGYYHDGKLDSYDLLNASLTWQHNATTVTLWGRNLTDKDYPVHGLYFAADPRDDFGAWQNKAYFQAGEPRVYGIALRYSF